MAGGEGVKGLGVHTSVNAARRSACATDRSACATMRHGLECAPDICKGAEWLT